MLQEYAEHVERSCPVIWIDGVPWSAKSRVLEPLALPHRLRPVAVSKVRAGMKRTGAWVARWTDAWDTAPCDWWWVICDDSEYDVEKFGKNGRRDVRAGLRRCEVSRLDPPWFAVHGYAVYAAASARYGTTVDATAAQFASSVLESAQYSGRETWGATVDGKLAAYASCIVVEDAVLLSWAKSDPQFHKAMPNNALAYVLTRHYLCERRLRYVTDGSRAVLHATQYQDFLEKMGYRRTYCPLRLAMHPLLSTALRMRVGTWMGPLLARLTSSMVEKLRTVDMLARIARSCRTGIGQTPAPAVPNGQADASGNSDDNAPG